MACARFSGKPDAGRVHRPRPFALGGCRRSGARFSRAPAEPITPARRGAAPKAADSCPMDTDGPVERPPAEDSTTSWTTARWPSACSIRRSGCASPTRRSAPPTPSRPGATPTWEEMMRQLPRAPRRPAHRHRRHRRLARPRAPVVPPGAATPVRVRPGRRPLDVGQRDPAPGRLGGARHHRRDRPEGQRDDDAPRARPGDRRLADRPTDRTAQPALDPAAASTTCSPRRRTCATRWPWCCSTSTASSASTTSTVTTSATRCCVTSPAWCGGRSGRWTRSAASAARSSCC